MIFKRGKGEKKTLKDVKYTLIYRGLKTEKGKEFSAALKQLIRMDKQAEKNGMIYKYNPVFDVYQLEKRIDQN